MLNGFDDGQLHVCPQSLRCGTGLLEPREHSPICLHIFFASFSPSALKRQLKYARELHSGRMAQFLKQHAGQSRHTRNVLAIYNLKVAHA